MKYSLLVVDDNYGRRKETYDHLLGSDFDLEFLSTQNQFEAANLDSSHAIVVHVNLVEGWVMSLKDVLERTKGKPVILVSAQWTSGSTKGVLDYVFRNARDYNVVHFIFLKEAASDDYNEATRATITFALDKHYGRAQFEVGDNDPINILHISDPQFGDELDPASFAIENDLAELFGKDRNARHVDFIAITGDITYSGRPSEFIEAEKWIERLMKALWKEKYLVRDRLLLVPGNHDVNLGLLAADIYQYVFKSKGYAKHSRDKEHVQFGLTPFREFAYKLTRDPQCLSSQDVCWVNDSFRYLGLRFYHLNSAANITPSAPDASSVPPDFLLPIKEREEDVFPIVLSHHGPSHSKFDQTKCYDNWEDIKQFLKHSRAKLLLHGHGHARTATHLDDWDETRGIVRVMAPSTHLILKKQSPGERRGFNMITLEREGMRVKKICVRPYEYRDGKMQPISEKPLEFVL